MEDFKKEPKPQGSQTPQMMSVRRQTTTVKLTKGSSFRANKTQSNDTSKIIASSFFKQNLFIQQFYSRQEKIGGQQQLLRAVTKREGAEVIGNPILGKKKELTILSEEVNQNDTLNIVAQTKQLLSTNIQVISSLAESNMDLNLDQFLEKLEKVINNNIQPSEIDKFQIQPKSREEPCKQVLNYLLNLRNNSSDLVNTFQRFNFFNQQQELNMVKQRLRDLETVKKEEILKKLETKEQECIELKSRIDRINLQGLDIPQIEVPQASIDVEYQQKQIEIQQEFHKANKFLHNYISELTVFQRNFNSSNSTEAEKEKQLQYLNSQSAIQLDKLKQLQEQLQDENSSLYQKKLQNESSVQSLTQNVRFLENKLSSTMTQKEEQVIKLKSEIVILKNKIIQYKQKLKDSVQTFETKKIAELQAQKEEELQLKQLEIENNRLVVEQQTVIIERLQNEMEQLKNKMQQDEENLNKQILEQNFIITEMSEKLQGIDQDYGEKLSKVSQIRDMTQKRLNIEEKERTLNTIKLEYLINNFKKLQLQKKFLETTIDSDMKSLTNEMRKTELELQKESYISTSMAQNRINTMYSTIKESLKYVKEVITFMNFDIDQVSQDNKPGNSTQQKQDKYSKDNKDVIPEKIESRNEKKMISFSNPSQFKDTASKLQNLTLEKCFYKYIYELAEVILTVLSETFKESRIQSTIEFVQLFEMLQQKTDKTIVQEIYTRFFSQSRIQFAQFMQVLTEKSFDIEQERNDLKMKVQKLNIKIQDMMDDQDKEQVEGIKAKEDIYQDLLEEEFKELDFNQEQQRQSFDHLKQKLQQEMLSLQKHQTSGAAQQQQLLLESQPSQNELLLDQSKGVKMSTNNPYMAQQMGISNSRQSSAAVASALFKSQEKRVIELQLQENQALKERIKEIRLNMQRQISELQEQLKLGKEQHQLEMNKLKSQCHKDITMLVTTHKAKEADLLNTNLSEIAKLKEELKKGYNDEMQSLKNEYEIKIEEIRKLFEKTDKLRLDLNNELMKMKKQSIGNSQGGWGTFAVVFEENPRKFHPSITLGTQSQNTQPTSPAKQIDIIQTFMMKKLMHTIQESTTLASSEGVQSQKSLNNDDNHSSTLPQQSEKKNMIDKINHFIEVGFLMDEKNFKHLSTYKEKAWGDSKLTKYLYEFQDKIDNHKAIQLQNKIREQLFENYALFNELNPFYITINLGRRVSPFYDESISQEQFKLIKREGYPIGDISLMVSFLKCDDPPQILVIRVIAFEVETFCQHSFDLTFDDLLLLVDGNMKLLEEEHHQELCQIILKNLTLVKSSTTTTQTQNLQKEPSVNAFDDKNEDLQEEPSEEKKEDIPGIPRVNDVDNPLKKLFQLSKMKKEQEMRKIGDTFLAVEHKLFFNDHYRAEHERNKVIVIKNEKAKKGLIQEKSMQTDFDKSIIYEAYEAVYESQIQLGETQVTVIVKRGKMSENMIMSVEVGAKISQELVLFNTDISKYNQSQQIAAEIIRIDGDSEILGYVFTFEKIYGMENYVLRMTQLSKYDHKTMSNFKWDPSQRLNHGSIKFDQETIYLIRKNNREFIRLQCYEILSTEIRSLLFMHSFGYNLSLVDFGKLQAIENVKIKQPFEKLNFGTMSLLLRDFGIIRLKIREEKVKQQLMEDQEGMDEEEEEQEEFKIEKVSVVFAFYDDQNCFQKGEVQVYLKIHSLQLEMNQKINFGELVQLSELPKLKDQKESILRRVFDNIILQKSEQSGAYEISIDKNQQPMNEVIESLKRQQFQAQIDEHDIIDCEILDPKMIGISLNQLAECQKIAQVSLINRKIFKITSYFVNNLKNLKLQPLTKRCFDWQLIYIDAFSQRLQKHIGIAITERDIIQILTSIKAKQNKQIINDNEIMTAKKEKLVEFILDSIVYDEVKGVLKVSLSHFLTRTEDRETLRTQFSFNGGKFISKLGQLQDQDLSLYKSSIPQIELTKKLILNIEKEFSDKTYDIRINEISLRKVLYTKIYEFEIFCIEQPSSIYRIDFVSQCHSHSGKKMLVERFNIIQQMSKDYEEAKFMKDGLVLCVLENSFPHKIIFMLLEPVSHIQWSYTVTDDKLNQIESRGERERFVRECRKQLELGMMHGVTNDQVQVIQHLGFQKELAILESTETAIDDDNGKGKGVIELWQGSLKSLINDQQTLIYARNIQVTAEDFVEVSIIAQRQFNSIKIVLSQYETHLSSVSFSLELSRESSRFNSGYLPINNHLKLLYLIDLSCAYTDQEKALRIILKSAKESKTFIDLVFTDKHLLQSKQFNVKDEIKLAFNTGFKDSFALYQKLPEIITDFKTAFIDPEPLQNFPESSDTSKILYRKIVKFHEHQLVVYLKYESIEKAESEWVVTIYEQRPNGTAYNESFFFLTSLILTKDEKQTLNSKNERIMKDIVQKVVDKRLRIKIVEERHSFIRLNDDVMRNGQQNNSGKRYLAYFIEPGAAVSSGMQAGSSTGMEIKKEMHNFDIRCGYRFSLTNPEALLPELDQLQTERLIVQLEKDNLIFDFNEILSPYELILRIKIFEAKSLKVISVSDVREYEIRKELMRDKMSYLMEPQRREELAKYLVQNMQYDELRKRIYFIQTPSTEEKQ